MTTDNKQSDSWTDTAEEPQPASSPQRKGVDANIVWAALLIVAGALLLVAQLAGISWGSLLWPLWVIVPGMALLILGFTVGRAAAEPLVALGSIATSTGLLLFYANASGHWASWAYAWALIAPTSIGVGLWLFGLINRRRDMVAAGSAMAKVGVVLFVAFGAFFELVLGISGFGLGRYSWAVLLIALGVGMILRSLWRRPKHQE